MATVKVCVVGAAGRMGQRTLSLIDDAAEIELSAAVDKAAGEGISSDAAQAIPSADVVIDFSAPPACVEVAALCADHGVAYIVASTGLSEADGEAIARASERVPVLQAANLSVGINALAELVETAVRRLGATFDVEIFEIHHRHKRDAPSGTAHLLADAARAGGGDMSSVLGRSGVAPRADGELGIAAARGGDVSGEHTVFLLGEGERIELVHRATTPDIFARGALRAAVWIAGQPSGLYGMRDVLGGGR